MRVKVLLISTSYLVITALVYAHEGHEGPKADPLFELWMVISAVVLAAAVVGIGYWWDRGRVS